MQRLLLIACALALCASLSAFTLVAFRPDLAERQAHSAVLSVLKREMSTRFGRNLPTPQIADALQRDLRDRVAVIEDRLYSGRPELEALVFSYLCHFQCGSPVDLAKHLRAGLHQKIAKLEAGVARVRVWAESRYSSVASELVLELRVFTATNSLLLLIALLGAVRTRPHRTILALSGLLLVATTLGAYCYLANQNWLMTLVLADYVGWGYAAWVGALFALLVDIVFLRGHVTNALTSAVGSMFSGGT
jgi:hypothetical protein